jgi:hypothetical protein
MDWMTEQHGRWRWLTWYASSDWLSFVANSNQNEQETYVGSNQSTPALAYSNSKIMVSERWIDMTEQHGRRRWLTWYTSSDWLLFVVHRIVTFNTEIGTELYSQAKFEITLPINSVAVVMGKKIWVHIVIQASWTAKYTIGWIVTCIPK